MFRQQPDSPEEEEWKCPYPEEWICKDLKKHPVGEVIPRTRATFIKEFLKLDG